MRAQKIRILPGASGEASHRRGHLGWAIKEEKDFAGWRPFQADRDMNKSMNT